MTLSALMHLQGANRALVQQLADATSSRDYWHDTCLAAEKERSELRAKLARARAELESEHVEAEGLRRQLAKAEAQLTRAEALAISTRETAAQLLERLATLDAAEAALQAERQLRREAEHELVMAEDLLRAIRQRAKRAEADLKETSGNLRRMVELNEWSRNELDRMGKQAERAEALAALVTPGLAALLESMASCCREYADVREPADRLHPSRGYVMHYRKDAKNARARATQIREALDDQA